MNELLIFERSTVGPALQQSFKVTGNNINFDINPGADLVSVKDRSLLSVRHYIDSKAISVDAVHCQTAAIQRHRTLDRQVMLQRWLHFKSIAQR